MTNLLQALKFSFILSEYKLAEKIIAVGNFGNQKKFTFQLGIILLLIPVTQFS